MEPALRGVRPMRMGRALRSAFVVVVCGALLTGCGSDDAPEKGNGGSAGDRQDPSSASGRVGQCSADSPAVLKSEKFADIDVDGDGRADAVRVTPPDNDCPNVLFAKTTDGYLSAPLPVGAPLVVSVFGVTLPGRDGDLVVTRQQHPRGGYQLRVFAVGGAGLAELLDEQRPLIPFVATDVDERPLSVDCDGARVVVTEAVTHQPGAVPSWDVSETSYSIDGSEVTHVERQDLEAQVPAAQLGRKYPAVATYAVFPSCRA